jgi:UDP-GlcNAc3NAcA epimerase
MIPKILSIIGARPQFIKAWALSFAIREHGKMTEILVHTGQHYDAMMSDIFFEELGLPNPDYHLGIHSTSQGAQVGHMIEKLEEALLKEKPKLVIIYGDTNSTLAGALTAAKLNIPVAHVEAGMRCGDMKMPEEINRIVADRLSTLFFCPTESSVGNLKREGITNNVYLAGDVMLDSFRTFLPVAQKKSKILKNENLHSGDYHLLTVHRAENTDSPERLRAILDGLSDAGLPVVFPIHPRTKKVIAAGMTVPKTIRMIEPVSYMDMLVLESSARMILTDSGGVQKESYLAGVPCLTLREKTEWPETVAAGWNMLVGADPVAIRNGIRDFSPSCDRPEIFGPTGASARISGLIEKYLS